MAVCWVFVGRGIVSLITNMYRRWVPAQTGEETDFATIATAVAAVALVALSVPAAIGDSGHRALVLILLTVCVPIYLRHLLPALRSETPRGAAVTCVALGAVVFGALPWAGAAWWHSMHMVAVVVLLTFRPPLGVLISMVVVGAVIPCALLLGAPAVEAVWWSVTSGMRVIAVYTLVWLVVALRGIRQTTALLAEQAVLAERLRITAELNRTVQQALEEIAGSARRTNTQMIRNRQHAAQVEISHLVDTARYGLSQARRLIRRMQTSSLQQEFAGGIELLAATGIQARVEFPHAEPPDRWADTLRTELHELLTALLHSGATAPVVITVRSSGATWTLDCEVDTAQAAI